MKFHVTFEAYDTIIGKDVPTLRQNAGGLIQRMLESGKVTDHGIFVGKRGGFMVIEAASNEELFNTIGNMVDLFEITVTPLVGIEALGEFFKNHPFTWS